MKQVFRGLPTFVWALCGLLAIAAVLLTAGQRDDQADPSADSFDPSGTSAFVGLLRSQGYRVTVDRWPRPRVSAGDVVIAFPVIHARLKLTDAEGEALTKAPRTDFDEFQDYVREKTYSGVNFIELPVSSDFLASSRRQLSAGPNAVTPRTSKQPLQVDMWPTKLEAYGSPPASDPGDGGNRVRFDAPHIGLWGFQPRQFFADIGSPGAALTAYQLGAGRILVATDGSPATNRFIDRNDNALAMMRLVAMVAHPGGRIVVSEAASGNGVPPSLMEVIGPWAYAGWQQLLFLGLVVVVTLGKRFGIPEETRGKQRGARDLLDALADTYLRGRHASVSVASALERSEHELRTALRLPRDASVQDLNRALPVDLSQTLSELRQSIDDPAAVSPDDALKLIIAARTQTDVFLGKRRMS